MNTVELTGILKKKVDSNTHFLGVLACDQLPHNYVTRIPTAAVINTHDSTMPGDHWLGVYISSDRNGYFFDSFGNPPNTFPHYINNFLKRNCINVSYSTRQVQADNATTCGQHCVFFLCNILKHHSYERVMRMYTYNKQCNDIMVCKFVSRIQPGLCRDHDFTCIQSVCNGKKNVCDMVY